MYRLCTWSKSLWFIMLCFCISLFLFVIMNFIQYIMYELCANYEIGILDYVFHI